MQMLADVVTFVVTRFAENLRDCPMGAGDMACVSLRKAVPVLLLHHRILHLSIDHIQA